MCRRCAAAARQRPLHRMKPCSKLSVRQHLSVSLREPAPLKGSLPSQATHPQSLPLRGGGAPEGRDGEVCRRCAAAARQRPLHRMKPCSKLSVRQHLSVSLREPAPLKGSLPSQATHPQSLPLRGGGAPEGRDGEVCRRCAAAARQRPLHRMKPCSKLSVRQHLSVSLREPAPLKGSLPSQATHPKPLLDERSEGIALLHAGVLWEPQPVLDAAARDSLFLRRKIFVVDTGWMHLGYNYGVW